MLNYDKDIIYEYDDLKRGELRERLSELQRKLIEKNIPVIIMVDGFE